MFGYRYDLYIHNNQLHILL